MRDLGLTVAICHVGKLCIACVPTDDMMQPNEI